MPPLLRVSDLQTYYASFGGARVVKAVDGVSFTLNEGETIGLVGERDLGPARRRRLCQRRRDREQPGAVRVPSSRAAPTTLIWRPSGELGGIGLGNLALKGLPRPALGSARAASARPRKRSAVSARATRRGRCSWRRRALQRPARTTSHGCTTWPLRRCGDPELGRPDRPVRDHYQVGERDHRANQQGGNEGAGRLHNEPGHGGSQRASEIPAEILDGTQGCRAVGRCGDGSQSPRHATCATEPTEEVIIVAKHEARPDDRCLRGRRSDGLFSLSLCAVRDRQRCQAGAEGRNVDQARHAMAMCKRKPCMAE
jgi:hypothetical protein